MKEEKVTNHTFDRHYFTDNGINLVHIFNLSDLPASLKQDLSCCCDNLARYRQVLLLGHGGRMLWDVLHRGAETPLTLRAGDPIDSFVENLLHRYLSVNKIDHQLLYPASRDSTPVIDLQRFGKLAGWHEDTPFLVGINPTWGTWFAYRALVVLDSDFQKSELPLTVVPAPCSQCSDRPCITQCPANAITSTGFLLDACIEYRLQGDSGCKHRCISRSSCPVSSQHQYKAEQMAYHYDLSLVTIKQYRGKSRGKSRGKGKAT